MNRRGCQDPSALFGHVFAVNNGVGIFSMKNSLTRRTFILAAASAGAATIVGCPPTPKPVTVYRRSCRGLHQSNAAKKHSANRLYATVEAAAQDLAHPGDRARVVSLTISKGEYDRLFKNGRLIVDLRHV